jgi:RNA recognition motif-containing protein
MRAKLFISGFPHYFSEQKLRSLVSQYGHIASASIVRSARGPLGLIEMFSLEEAANAAKALTGQKSDGKVLEVTTGETERGVELEQLFTALSGKSGRK